MLRVAFLPVYPNPYQHLLARALAGEGVVVFKLARLPGLAWLRQERGRTPILHLHWLSGLYMARWRTPLQTIRFINWLRLARGLGYRLIWTAHNTMPHVLAGGWAFHSAIRRLVITQADGIITHCEVGKRELLARFPHHKPTHIVPIGSYAGVYPLHTTRAEARGRLGLSEKQFVYLFLGNIAAYKGLEPFVDAFRAVAAANDVALIAGRNRDAALVERLQAAAAADPRLRVDAREIADEEMQFYLRAADVMVAPFRRVLTSSSVMVGLSYGLPVIVPRLGCLPELVTAEAGIVYDPEEPPALAEALQRIKQCDLERMGNAAAALAQKLSWKAIARQTAEIYHTVLEPQ